MHSIWTIIIGFFAGLIARAVIPGDDKIGLILTTALGIVGAFFGSFIGQTMGWAQPGQPIDFFSAVMGAALILYLVKAITGRAVKS